MKISSRLARITVLVIVIAITYSAAQYPGVLSTDSPRPLIDLIEKLNIQYEWSINYEDAPVTAPDDLVDITPPSLPGQRRIFGLLSFPFTVSTELPDPKTLLAEEQTNILAAREQEKVAVEAILREYKKSGNRGSFVLWQHGKYIDVFPDKIRDKNGRYEQFEPILSTKVSVPEGTYRLDELLWLVCGQIAQKRGIPIVHGTVPINIFLSIALKFHAENEPARQVLESAFEDTKAIRASHGAYDIRYFRWALLYDPDVQTFAMNIRWTSKDLPGVPNPYKFRPDQQSEPHWSKTPIATQK